MRQVFLIFLELCIIINPVSGQTQSFNKVCSQTLNFNDPRSILKGVANLKVCGLDSTDIKIFSNEPILGSILVNLATSGKLLTWGDLLNGINTFKQTAGYQSIRSNTGILDNQLTNKNDPPKSFVKYFATIEDHQIGLSLSKKTHKPLLVYFNAYHGVNCRRFENEVFENPDVVSYLKKFVIVNLYVDDRKTLQKPYHLKNGKVIKTVGDRNSDLQISKFLLNTQPLISIINPEDNCVIQSVGYVNSEGFFSFLKKSEKLWKFDNP